MSSGQWKKKLPFNPVQIKNGFIVRLGKDGRIRAVLDTWPPSKDSKKWQPVHELKKFAGWIHSQVIYVLIAIVKK